jgi:hypothetical protein
MRTGARTEIVSIQQETTVTDPDTNYPIGTGWTDYRTEIFADVLVRRANEVVESDQRRYEAMVVFAFDFYDVEGVTPKMTILFGGIRHDIINIIPDYQEKRITKIEARAQGAVV